MPCHSMTGFGQAVHRGHDAVVKVEIRTVNHRFSEWNLRMPRDLVALEEDVRRLLAKYIHRGRGDVYLTLDPTGQLGRKPVVDWDLLDGLVELEQTARARFGLTANVEPQPEAWLRFPDVVELRHPELQLNRVRSDVLAALDAACLALCEMRRREGARLEADLRTKVNLLLQAGDVIETRAQVTVSAYVARMRERLASLIGQQIDDQRLLTEAATAADRLAIDEEVVRLKSHCGEFLTSLQSEAPIGRRLDFIVQEMHREVNTIGSKSQDSEISRCVVDAKVWIEQLREQVQNVE